MEEPIEVKADERVGLKVVIVTAIVFVVLLGLYWGGRKLLLAPPAAPDTETGVTVSLKECNNPKVYTSVDEALQERDRVCIIDLSNQGLTELSPFIGYMVKTRTLNLGGNKLTSLPPQIGLLTEVRDLDLSDNQLAEFPAYIGYMAKLERLNLSNNTMYAFSLVAKNTVGLDSDLSKSNGILRKL